MTNEDLNDNIWNALEKERESHEQRITQLTAFLLKQEQERNKFLANAFNTQNNHLQAILKKLEEPQNTEESERRHKELLQALQNGLMSLQDTLKAFLEQPELQNKSF